MPNIQSYAPRKNFKKTTLRAWDKNLLDKLKYDTKESGTESGTNTKESGTESGTNTKESGTESGTNTKESGTESGTNTKESGTESGTNTKESGTESGTNTKESGTESGTNTKESGTESGTNTKESGTESGTNTKESGTESGTNTYSIDKIRGVSLSVIIYLISNLKSKNPPITINLNMRDVADNTCHSLNSIQQSIKRLKKRGLIKTSSFLSGYNGYTSFELCKSLYKFYKYRRYNNSNNNINNITIEESENSLLKSRSKNVHHSTNFSNQALIHNKDVYDNSKKNNYSHLNNASTQQSKSITPSNEDRESKNAKLTYEQLPEEWQNINYHLIEDLHFKPHHLIALYKLNALDPETIDESIRHFAYGIKHNPDNYKKYTDPLKVFYGSLRKGMPWTESTYKSTKEIAIEELIQQKKQAKRKLADQECELIDSLERESFYKWHQNLSNEQKKEIREEHSRKHNNIYSYYDEKIFKLHYSKEVMTEYQDPKEKALEQYLEKKKEQKQNEVKRITEMLQKTGSIKDYFAWLDKQTNEELAKITERKNFTHETMTQEEANILKVYFAKNILTLNLT
ncbi:hypothetical protein [Candidatus Bandiella euplotis]|uniref:Replication protein n=1 Tax=Candidatus Bandiella euplotis TaxID=1664265 RepID=A0ABZ0UML9_9RICK|nr:hypothetical protein [Candidatus Bandiella woodruffii]WPX97420.1 hypothetical protein Bandiella_01574 [Candidatus Bandiella woodruffii]